MYMWGIYSVNGGMPDRPVCLTPADKLRAPKATVSFIGMLGSPQARVHENGLTMDPADRPGATTIVDIRHSIAMRTSLRARPQAV